MVHINGSPTRRAGPPFPLSPDEIPDAMLPDRSKVLEHAHVVSHPVPLVQLAEPPTRELVAGMVVPLPDPVAGGNRAVPAALPFLHITPLTPVLRPKISRANSTVHSAGCNKHRPEGVLRRHYVYINRSSTKKVLQNKVILT